jgi:CheY-like chemotaxis protein
MLSEAKIRLTVPTYACLEEVQVDNEVRVLVVDDHPEIVESLAQMLELDGYAVRTARDGREALALADEFRPMCVLLDLAMPVMDGTALARELRKRHGRDIILVAVTGRGDVDVGSTELDEMDHWIAKPIDFKTLARIFPPVSH